MTSSSAPVDAKQVLAFRRSLFPRRPVLSYMGTIYVAIFALAMMVALTWGFWRHLAGLLSDVGFAARFTWAPAAVLLLSLAVLRYSLWQGFVSFSEADCFYLLTAPLERGALVWPRLRSACWVVGVAGALLGMVGGLVSSQPVGGALRVVLGAVAGPAFGVILVAAGWQVQRLPRASLWLIRLTTPALVVVLLLVLAEWAGGRWRNIALWSGPWGWAVMPLAGGSWWARGAALGLLCALAVAGWLGLKWSAGACSLENFWRRARARSRAVAGAYSFDARAVVLAARETSAAASSVQTALAQTALRRTGARPPTPRLSVSRLPTPRLSVPRRPRLAVPWHGLLTLLRSPYRLGWGVLLGGGGVVLLTAFPHRLSALLGGALALYLAAGAMLEPLRLEMDSPFVSQILLPPTFGEVLWRHCLLPGAVLIGEGLAAIAALWGMGAATGTVAVSALALLVPTVGFTVMAAALSARRGGRLPMEILLSAAGDVTGFSVIGIIGWIFGWVLLAVAGVTMAWQASVSAGGTGGAAGAVGLVRSVLPAALALLVGAEIMRRLLLRSRR